MLIEERLSENQCALWFLQQLEPSSGAYNTVFAAWVRGPLDTGALRRAFEAVIAEQPLLRARFPERDGAPFAEIPRDSSLLWREHDCTGWGADRVLDAARRASLLPFDLAAGPPCRVDFFFRGSAAPLLLWTLHHIVADLASHALLLAALGARYGAEVGEGQGSPPPPPRRWADFVTAEAEADHGRALDYWAEKLREAPPLDLVPDHGRPAVYSSAGGSVSRTIAVGPLRDLARAHGTSLSSALLAAWASLLGRLSGAASLVVGLPTAGRPAGFEQVVGSFVNTLPVRLDLSGDPSGGALLGRAHAAVREALAHAVPFPLLMERLAPARDPSRPALYQCSFVLQRLPQLASVGLAAFYAPSAAGALGRLGPLQVEATPLEQQCGQTELGLWALEHEGRLHLELKFASALFSAETAARLLDALLALIDGLQADPGCALSRLPLMSPARRQAEIARFAFSTPPAPFEAVHHRFLRHARARPEATALRFEGEGLSYAALAARAAAVARALKAAGVGRGDRVGLCLERSAGLVAAILGVLRRGAAYVPLDPVYPPERLALQVEDAGLRVALVDGTGARALPEGIGKLRLDQILDDEMSDSEISDVDEAIDPEDIAYIIYTSGSTGLPKGVPIPHRAVARLFDSTADRMRAQPDDVWSCTHSFAFDVSVCELWGALAHGGALLVVPTATTRDGEALWALLVREGVTVLSQTPSAFQLLQPCAIAAARGPGALRLVLFAGEALDPAQLAPWFAAFGDARPTLVNLYGITETTVHLTWRPMRAGDRGSLVGPPFPDTQIYLLDPLLQPVPPGAVGEICVGGPGLSPGYLHRPALTAERFVPCPFPDAPWPVIYRSGDLARLRYDGELEVLGRRDGQVKIRGHRIELGEVEAAISAVAGVEACRVALREDPARGRHLVAWVVGGPGAAALRAALEARLPAVMMPAAFTDLPALPLTANGKLNRAALPAPDYGTAAGEAPRGGAEVAVAEAFQALLGLAEVRRDTDFFAAGGHSLLAVALRERLRRSLGLELPMSLLFQQPTVAGLAAALREQAPPADEAALLPDPASRLEPFPLREIQAAYWVGRQADLALGGVAAQLYWEFAQPALDAARLEASFRRLIARHDLLRAVVRPDGQQQVLPTPPPWSLEVSAPGEDEAALLEIRARLSQRVAQDWPYFAVALSRTAPGETRLHLCFDALFFDAASILLLLEEWGRLYADPALDLPPLRLSFRDLVLAERARAGSEAARRDEAWWLARSLPPAPPLPVLPLDPGQRPGFVWRERRLDAPTWAALRAAAARRGLTPSALLCAAYAEALGAWCRADRFTLNLTSFHRPAVHPEAGAVVGDFTRLLLLEVDRRGACFADRARALAARLAEDLDHGAFDGLALLRALSRGEAGAVSMPVVFTSAIGLGRRLPAFLGRRVAGLATTPQVWLDHAVFEEDEGLTLAWNAVEALFPPGLLDDLIDAQAGLLRALAQDPGRWERAETLTPAAHRALSDAVNQTAAPVSEATLHGLVLRSAETWPASPAVIAADGVLCYRDLVGRASAVAAALDGAGPLVGVALRKGWGQAVAALGVNLSGRAWTPLDPDQPPARLAAILAQAGVTEVVTDRATEAAGTWPEGVRRLCHDALAPIAAIAAPPADPDALAYVIYTSGSTGQPKGVMISHRGAVNTILDVNARFGVGPQDRVLGLSALGFDLAVYDLFGLLAAGGALVLPPPGAARDPSDWAARLVEHRVTIWNSVPALLEMLVSDRAGRPPLPGLRLVLLSGDWIPLRLLPLATERLGGPRLISLGGATEASIWSILRPIGDLDPRWSSVPYGRPMRNQTVTARAPDGALCPLWVPGELHIGGLGVALGYWRDPTRTAAAFVTGPDGERLYRTGDLGRLLPSGEFEILGREDFQVKVGGHRIELGEVEAALGRHPEVGAAVVSAVGPDRHSRQLVAWVVPAAPALAPGEVALPPLRFDAARLAPYRRRRSARAFPEPVTLAALASLLACLAPSPLPGESGPRRRYPSAGGRYPVWVAVIAASVEGLAPGLWRYDPSSHRLRPLGPARIDPAAHWPLNQPVARGAAFQLLLVADLDALQPSYGALARDFALLEAGALSQLLMEEAEAAGLGLCPIGSFEGGDLSTALGLGAERALLHSLLGGGARAEAAEAGAEPALPERLRRWLASQLPAYMVPQRVILTEALPLSANGKVDRRALRIDEAPAPPPSAPAPAPPATAAEAAVLALAREVLGLPELGSRDPFFEAGGNSIHLVQLAARIRERLGVEVPVAELFRRTTAAALAALVRADATPAAPPAAEPAPAPPEASEPPNDRRAARAAARKWRSEGRG